jgi:alkylation response protein AidB-like acyl-CoA dehydrogenase
MVRGRAMARCPKMKRTLLQMNDVAEILSDRDALLRRAQQLVPILAERSARAEELRRVPDETMEDFLAAKLMRIVQPARFGGYEMDWDALCEMGMVLARGCMSQAWVATVLAEHAWLAGLFPLQAQEDIWGHTPDALISTGLVPTGSAKRVGDGFVLNGRWPFSSGVYHTQWVILGELVRELDQPPAMSFFLLPKADFRVVDDWHTMGMSGTGSCSIEVDNVFVPSHRSLAANLIAEARTPGAALSAAPVFRMPLSGFAPTVLAAVVVGAAQGMVEAYTDGAVTKAQAGSSPPGHELALSRIAESAAEATAARLLILESTKANMAKLRRGERLNDKDGQATSRDSAFAAVLSNRAARRIFEASGARNIYQGSAIQRTFRDISAASMHAALNWDKISVAYGRSVVIRP